MNLFSWLKFKAVAEDQGSSPPGVSRPSRRKAMTVSLKRPVGIDRLMSGRVPEAPGFWSENCDQLSRATVEGGNVKVLSKQKCQVLAERNGWSLERARGYVDGETCRQRAKKPSPYALVGIDDYSLGFRAAYYERRNGVSKAIPRGGSPEERAAEKV